MDSGDKKRLLRAWLAKKRTLFKLAAKYTRVFGETPEDMLQRAFEILLKRESWPANENVIHRAKDAMQNLSANRKRSFDYKARRHFSHRAPDEDDPSDDGDHEDTRPHPDIPTPEAALIAKETVEIHRAFLAELKKGVSPIALGVITAGEEESFDTTDLMKKLKASRQQIYDARRAIKEKAEQLRDEWTESGRELPGFMKKKEKV